MYPIFGSTFYSQKLPRRRVEIETSTNLRGLCAEVVHCVAKLASLILIVRKLRTRNRS